MSAVRVFCTAAIAALATPALAVPAHAAARRTFAQAMNSICATADAQSANVGSPQSLADLVKKGPLGLAIDRRALESVVKLGKPPARVAPYVTQWIALQRRINGLESQAIAAAGTGKLASVNAVILRADAVEQTQNTAARKIGAGKCVGAA